MWTSLFTVVPKKWLERLTEERLTTRFTELVVEGIGSRAEPVVPVRSSGELAASVEPVGTGGQPESTRSRTIPKGSPTDPARPRDLIDTYRAPPNQGPHVPRSSSWEGDDLSEEATWHPVLNLGHRYDAATAKGR
jgi:hypothetical protein